jgi:K+-sensing histidine kinase KdpD
MSRTERLIRSGSAPREDRGERGAFGGQKLAARTRRGDSGTLLFRVSRDREPGVNGLRAALSAHFELERARGVREICVHAMALFGAFLWLAALRPSSITEELRIAALAGFPLFLSGWAFEMLSIARLQRRSPSPGALADSPGPAQPERLAPRRASAMNGPEEHRERRGPPAETRGAARRASRLAYVWATALVGAATAAGALLQGHLAAPDEVVLYLLVIGVSAALFGRGPSLLASALSVGAYGFCFVPPYYTFAIDDERYLLTFAMMFAVGLAISGLTSRIRRQTVRARTEELRSSLLSAVSHDLRTPLAAITGAATMLRQSGMETRDREELLETICDEAARLERLVRNLLDMTRLQSGELKVAREWVPLEEIVGSALARVEPLLAGRAVSTDLPLDLPLVSADPLLVEQVFVNLLENAVKHTPAGTPVEISARASHGRIGVEVADRGPGLPRGTETAVFEKFFRGPDASSPGAGLGLAICRGIVAAHGGTLTAENREGGGALFRIVLPQPEHAPSVPSEGDAEPARSAT